MNNYYYYSPVGVLELKSDGAALLSCKLYDGEPCDTQSKDHALTLATQWLDAYFAGEMPPQLPPMRLAGSEFQTKVWNLLLEIPYGETRTYGELARSISPTMSAQAIGGAVHNNPIAILVPCHRVVGANGNLTGYAYGLGMKSKLLAIETQTIRYRQK